MDNTSELAQIQPDARPVKMAPPPSLRKAVQVQLQSLAQGYLLALQERILALQMLTDKQASELRRASANGTINRSECIVLVDPRGKQYIPVFQFMFPRGSGMVMRPQVAAINRRLRTTKTPWATAAFWTHTYPHDTRPLYWMADGLDCYLLAGYHVSGINVVGKPHPGFVGALSLDAWLRDVPRPPAKIMRADRRVRS